jgi:hypothetical protein
MSPVSISLMEHNLIGVFGTDQKVCNKIAQIMAAQISSYHSYSDVRLGIYLQR